MRQYSFLTEVALYAIMGLIVTYVHEVIVVRLITKWYIRRYA